MLINEYDKVGNKSHVHFLNLFQIIRYFSSLRYWLNSTAKLPKLKKFQKIEKVQLYTSPDRKLWRHRCAMLSNVTNFHSPKNDTFSALYSGLAQWAQLKNYLKKTKKVKNEDTEDSEVINITTRWHCCSFTPVPVPVKSGRGTKSTWIFIHWRRPRMKILKVMMRS